MPDAKTAKEKSTQLCFLLTPAAAALFGNFLAADLFQRADIVSRQLPHHGRGANRAPNRLRPINLIGPAFGQPLS